MKISGLQENLKQGLGAVNHIANKNINLPILNNVLIEAKDGNIKLTATNLEIGVVSKVRGKIEKEGSFTVDAKIISDYINLLPNKKVDIKLEENNLVVESENYKTKIRGMAAEEYPLIPNIDRTVFFGVSVEQFKKALSSVVFAAAAGDSRIELSGTLFIFKKDNLILAATDSYRLAEKKIKVKTNNNEDKRIIVPTRTLQELIRILSSLTAEDVSGENKELTIYVSDNQILFVCGNIELTSRLIEGQYPDYEQIIPTKNKTKALVDRNALIRAVKASALFAKSGINDINLDFPIGKNKTIISSSSGQTGENIAEVESTVDGDDNGVVINYRYLLDGLSNLDSENVWIEIIDGNTPCLLRAEKGDDYLYIIMPIKQ